MDLNSIKGIDNLELIFKIIRPNKAILTDKNNSNLDITKNLIIWNLNQGQINSLEFSFWSLNKLLIGISTILIIIIFAYLLRFYRFKVGKKFRWQILIYGPEGTKIPLPDRSILWKLIPKNVFLTIDVSPAEL